MSLTITVKCRCSVHLALPYTSLGSIAVSLADGSEVAALISLQEEQSSTKGDLNEPWGLEEQKQDETGI